VASKASEDTGGPGAISKPTVEAALFRDPPKSKVRSLEIVVSAVTLTIRASKVTSSSRVSEGDTRWKNVYVVPPEPGPTLPSKSDPDVVAILMLE
jgi:hypothetical protein